MLEQDYSEISCDGIKAWNFCVYSDVHPGSKNKANLTLKYKNALEYKTVHFSIYCSVQYVYILSYLF